ncbi:MAG: hypothetical protein JXR53_15850 [Bacteroidales bacterium]|nr:hypothetical protein [Bacteroidales bacterium]
MSKYIQPLFPGKIYHVFNHAVGKDKLFYNEDNYSYFNYLFSKYFIEFVSIYAYCLVPNHFHLVIRTEDEAVFEKHCEKDEDFSQLISKKFSNFFNAYSKAFNKAHNRRGPLFYRPFKRIEIDSNDYLQQVVQYVHYNPIHHGLVSKISEWKHSSFFEISQSASIDKYVEMIKIFGSRENFINRHIDLDELNMTEFNKKYLFDEVEKSLYIRET